MRKRQGSDGTKIPLATDKKTLTFVTCLPFRSFSEGGRPAHYQVGTVRPDRQLHWC